MSTANRRMVASRLVPMARRHIVRHDVITDTPDAYVVKLAPPCKLYRPRCFMVQLANNFAGTTPTVTIEMYLISSGAAQSEITHTAQSCEAQGVYFFHTDSGKPWYGVLGGTKRTASDNFQITWAGDDIFSTVDGDGRVTSGNDDMCAGATFAWGAEDGAGDVTFHMWYDELGENESDLR